MKRTTIAILVLISVLWSASTVAAGYKAKDYGRLSLQEAYTLISTLRGIEVLAQRYEKIVRAAHCRGAGIHYVEHRKDSFMGIDRLSPNKWYPDEDTLAVFAEPARSLEHFIKDLDDSDAAHDAWAVHRGVIHATKDSLEEDKGDPSKEKQHEAIEELINRLGELTWIAREEAILIKANHPTVAAYLEELEQSRVSEQQTNCFPPQQAGLDTGANGGLTLLDVASNANEPATGGPQSDPTLSTDKPSADEQQRESNQQAIDLSKLPSWIRFPLAIELKRRQNRREMLQRLLKFINANSAEEV